MQAFPYSPFFPPIQQEVMVNSKRKLILAVKQFQSTMPTTAEATIPIREVTISISISLSPAHTELSFQWTESRTEEQRNPVYGSLCYSHVFYDLNKIKRLNTRLSAAFINANCLSSAKVV